MSGYLFTINNMSDKDRVLRKIYPPHSPRISLEEEYENFSKALLESEKLAIKSFTIENYFFESNQLSAWWYFHCEQNEFKLPLTFTSF